MNRAERRRIQREVSPIELGQRLFQRMMQAVHDAMRDNRISEERAEKILKETLNKLENGNRGEKNRTSGKTEANI